MNRYMSGMRDALVSAGIMRSAGIDTKAAMALGMGIGLLLGASAAVLLTPRTGPEARARLGLGARRIKNRTSEAAQKLVGRTNEAVQAARERLIEKGPSPEAGRNEIGANRPFG